MTFDSSGDGSHSVSTSPSLLDGVRARDGAAWRRLARLYSPMVYRWARRSGLQSHDAQDVVQNVFLAVASGIEHFQRGRPGDSFRGWLWTTCRNKILDLLRKRQHELQAIGGSDAQRHIAEFAMPELTTEEICAERSRLRHRALVLLRDQFEESVWQAFFRTVVHCDRPADVARDLGVSVATVYRARSRVQSQLRASLAEMGSLTDWIAMHAQPTGKTDREE